MQLKSDQNMAMKILGDELTDEQKLKLMTNGLQDVLQLEFEKKTAEGS